MKSIVIDKKIIITIVKIVMAILAIVCIIVESQFNYPKIKEYLGDPFALFLSILLPVFSSFAVEASAILRKQGIKGAAFALLFAAFFSMLFSVTMIVRGQYDKQMAAMNIAVDSRSEQKSETSLYELKNNQLTEKKESIERTQKEVDRLGKILEKNPNDMDAFWARYRENEDLKKLEIERDAINIELTKILSDGNVQQEEKETRTFDQWFADIIHWKAESIKLLLYMILPIFIVIIAPLGIYFSLGLYENSEKKAIKKESKKEKPRAADIKKCVEIWVQYNWMALKNGYNKIIPKETFLAFMKNKGIEFPPAMFDTIYELSEKHGCTKSGTIIETNDAESIKKILHK